METGLQVAEVMTRKPVQVPSNLSVRECARIMRDKDVGSLLVVNGELEGIVTEYDIVHKLVASGQDLDKAKAADVMTTALLTVKPDQDVYEALLLMRDNDIRHLPVMNAEQLVGFLTVKDILKVQPQLFELLLDSIDLREEDRKLALRPELRHEGFCEVCGNFTENLLPSRGRRLACEECRSE